jgi:hypothetical protein
MTRIRAPLTLAILCGAMFAAGCSQQSGGQAAAPTATAASQGDARADEAAKKLVTYQQLLKIHNEVVAVPIGQEIVASYPGTPAAIEVQKTLPALEISAKESGEKSRLENLWQYQVAPMQGGTQSTATIYSSQPGGDEHIRLVLRRHTDWGQSVFLFGSGSGFLCKGNCDIPVTFDGKTKTLKGFLPPTGEPAMFIKDDPGFIAALQKAKKITFEMTLKSRGKENVVYEVGGYDPDKWSALPKKK